MLGRFKKIQNFIRLNNIEPAEAEVIKAITLYSTTKEREVLEKADDLLDKLLKKRLRALWIIKLEEITIIRWHINHLALLWN